MPRAKARGEGATRRVILPRCGPGSTASLIPVPSAPYIECLLYIAALTSPFDLTTHCTVCTVN